MNGTERSWVCAIRGPITLITLGTLFALNNFTPYRFDQTWPVLLIVFGLLSILRRTVAPPPPPPPTQAPPYPYDQDSHGYRDSRYQQSAQPAGAAAPAPPTTGGTL